MRCVQSKRPANEEQAFRSHGCGPLLGPQTAVKARSFLYGTGAVSRLPTPPVRDVWVDGTVAYVALGGESDIVGVDA